MKLQDYFFGIKELCQRIVIAWTNVQNLQKRSKNGLPIILQKKTIIAVLIMNVFEKCFMIYILEA